MFLVSCGMPSKSNLVFDENGGLNLEPDMEVTYGTIKEEILNAKCINCHSNVATENGLKEWIQPGKPEQSPFFTKTENGSMPKNGSPLSTRDLELIRLYITQLAPSPTMSPEPTPSPEAGTNSGITYAQVKSRILDNYRCTSCHSVGTEAKLANWINTTSPERSRFYTMTKSGAMPENGPRVSSEDQNFILQYVKDYAARN